MVYELAYLQGLAKEQVEDYKVSLEELKKTQAFLLNELEKYNASESLDSLWHYLLVNATDRFSKFIDAHNENMGDYKYVLDFLIELNKSAKGQQVIKRMADEEKLSENDGMFYLKRLICELDNVFLKTSNIKLQQAIAGLISSYLMLHDVGLVNILIEDFTVNRRDNNE